MRAALESGGDLEALYVDEDALDDSDVAALVELARARALHVYPLARGVLERVADASTPQPILASARVPLARIEDFAAGGFLLIAHDLRDPGNAGTLIRSADATASAGVVFTGQSVDPFNPKTLRATAGSIFHVPVAVGEFEATLAALRERGVSVLASVVREGTDHRQVDFTKPTAVVIGNESVGLDAATVARCDAAVTIEMAGSSESLNAGVAAALFAFEAMWQRQGADGVPAPPSL